MEALEDMPLTSSGTGGGYYNGTNMMEQLLLTKTVADKFPPILGSVVTGGKTSVLSFLAVCTAFLVIGMPIWLLSMVIPEWSLYAFTILGIFFLGKTVMRMIVFPGSSPRVQLDIEAEFARYSVRMLESGAGAVIDVASTIISSSKANPAGIGNKRFGMGGETNSSVWKRACSYRDRVLVVYSSVLSCLLRDRTINANAANFTSNPPNGLLGSDIGNLGRVTMTAQSDGRILLALLQKVLQLMKTLEDGLAQNSNVSEDTILETAKALMNSATELRDLIPSFKPQGGDEDNGADNNNSGNGDPHAGNEDLEETSLDAVRQQLGQQGGSMLDTVKSGIEFVVSMLDPPLHTSIFGMDALRGCVLSRYKGARQLWVQRPKGGMIDVIHIPAVLPDGELTTTPGTGRRTNTKAVLYCNPNAGLIEVATGMSLAGGNVVPSSEETQPESWVDFYTQNGYDIYLFNYAGFGRSFGRSICGVDGRSADYSSFGTGCLSRTYRIVRSSFAAFKPTPDTLRADAAAVGRHLIHDMRVESLAVHGESIGGLAATGATRQLIMDGTTRNKISLLICDRTFCNLPAVAQRLLGRWSGTAVQMLEPFWNTDVAADYLAVTCPKVVANDAADMIVNDVSSLKSGIAFSTEIRKQLTTKGSGCILDSPMEYKLAEWENVGVLESKYMKPLISMSPPKWPRDRYVTIGEAFHFAACVRRIGKVATHSKNQNSSDTEDEGVELSQSMFLNETDNARLPKRQDQDLLSAWKALSCCDGLCGAPLGRSLNDHNDGTISWLCCTLTFGGQVVVEAADKRLSSVEISSPGDKKRIIVEPSDFDTRPDGYEKLESADKMVFPIPIPEVIATLEEMLKGQSAATNSVQRELEFCIGMLDYIVTRLSSAQVSELYTTNSSLHLPCGAFKKLHCGHNNQFSAEERVRLQEILTRSSILRGQSHV